MICDFKFLSLIEYFCFNKNFLYEIKTEKINIFKYNIGFGDDFYITIKNLI